MNLFVDTWGWIALGNPKEAHHEMVRERMRAVREQGDTLITTDYVLDETLTLLFVSQTFPRAVAFFEGVLEMANEGALTIETVSPARFAAAWTLRTKYRDKPKISFTDFTSFAVMNELGLTTVCTDDRHFAQVGLGFERIG